jgi:hypothetical protein
MTGFSESIHTNEKQAARMAGRLVQACDKCMHSGEKTLTD